jgi:D-alanine-D-alanine ligase
MRIGILYNISDQAKRGRGAEKTADTDIPGRVRAVRAVLEKRHTVVPVLFSLEIYSYLKADNFDVLFNMCEGFGDDNIGEAYIAGLLGNLDIPFTGADFFTLALCMDKVRAKQILRYHGLPTPEFQVFRSRDAADELTFQYPLILKPCYEDASIGIYQDSVVRDARSFRNKLADLFDTFEQPVLAEEYIEGRELNISLIGPPDNPEVLPVSEIAFDLPETFNRIVCYEAKWVKDSIPYTRTPAVCPATLSDTLLSNVQDLASKAYTVFRCRDYARVDMRVKETDVGEGRPSIIEINPNPGMYLDSGFVKSAAAAGMDYEALCYKLLELAMARWGMDTARLYGSGEKGAVLVRPDQAGTGQKDGLETARLAARRVTEEDIPRLLDWFNDPVIARYMEAPENSYDEQELYELLILSRVHDADLIFLDKNGNVPVGYGALYDVDYRIKKGEISFLIGNKAYLSKGYGSEIATAMVSFCFTEFGLTTIFASAVAENLPSRKALEKAGFREIGIRRKSHLVGSTYYDEVFFDIVAE